MIPSASVDMCSTHTHTHTNMHLMNSSIHPDFPCEKYFKDYSLFNSLEIFS